MVTAIVLTVVAIGAGLFAVVSLRAGSGGASTPSEAVERFIMAAASEDLLGVFDVLLPGERELFRDSALSLQEELSRLGVLEAATDLHALTGLDVIVDGLRLVPTTVSDDIVSVEVRGTVAVSGDVRGLPLGSQMDGLLGDLDPAEAAISLDAAPLDGLRLAAVERGGRWYVSIGFTIAEAARRDAGLDPVPPEAAVRPFGSPGPEAAVDQLLLALGTLDLERLIAVLNPDEAAALQRYAPLFLDDTQAAIDDLGLRWVVDDVTYDVSGGRDRAVVGIRTLRIEGTLKGVDFTFAVKDGCAELTMGRERTSVCSGDTTALDAAELGLDAETEALLADTAAMFDDLGPTGVIVKKVSGAWYVSPVASLVDNLLALLRAVGRDELDQVIERWTATLEDRFVGKPGPIEVSGISECFGETGDPAAVTECIQSGLAEGRFEASEVPAELRFPQCGLVEAWLYGYGNLTDEEFTATTEAAQLCFGLLAFEGKIDVLEIPYEAREPSCFGGVNPYALDDLREADRLFEAVNACLLGGRSVGEPG